ncbi:MAG: penicillin-binding protein 2 [Candidatus Nomurabacteria bacterium]|jgi:cell division protein FtsI (penicillin-binding protein 3)/stage V sporulation protein D (sporulation-specific penicillin-binding protein)|nr:penicillin-binding protein 2 [Candidatus Nomurabacteria bacterium]
MEGNRKIARSDLLIGVVFLVFAGFVWRLADLQIAHHDEYMSKANAMQVRSRILPAARGEIYALDADGSPAPLVLNEPVYEIAADPHLFYDGEKLDIDKHDALAEILRAALGDRVRAEGLENFDEESRYTLLAKQVSRTEAQSIQAAIKDRNIPAVSFTPSNRRVYIEGPLAAQTLGFVNMDGEGQYGIEQYLDDDLKGRDGLLQSVRDARDTPLPIGIHEIDIPAKDGDNIVLTIDRNIQSQVEDALKRGLDNVGATTGSIIVMNPQSGEVMAMANYPSYDPANFGKVENAEVFQNKIVSYAYEPGSVTKALTMGAGLDSGAITPSSTYLNSDCIDVDDAKICNVEKGLNRTLNMTDVLTYSLNTGVNYVLNQMGGGENNLQGRQVLYNYFTDHYRFGQPTGIEQMGESAGFLNPPDTPHGARVVYANMAFGQGLNITMLQFASAFCAAVNGGNYWKPALVAGTYDGGEFSRKNPYLAAEGVLKPESSQDLRNMLIDARLSFSRGVYDGGFRVGGKSGTAQIYDANTMTYSESDYVGTYVGFGVDKDNSPKYVIMVRVDDSHAGGFAGSVAAMPIFNEISTYMLSYLGVSKP